MKFVDLTGQRFGKLVIVGRNKENTTKNIKWDCICDCGNPSSVFRTSLLRSKSCGCSHYKSGKLNPKWQGHEDISLRHFNLIKRSAVERGLEFDIDIKYLWVLYLSQDKKCALTGMNLIFDSRGNAYDGTASLDRIDSSNGYIVGNVQWLHKHINMMKSNHIQSHFIALCEKVFTHDRNKKKL